MSFEGATSRCNPDDFHQCRTVAGEDGAANDDDLSVRMWMLSIGELTMLLCFPSFESFLHLVLLSSSSCPMA